MGRDDTHMYQRMHTCMRALSNVVCLSLTLHVQLSDGDASDISEEEEKPQLKPAKSTVNKTAATVKGDQKGEVYKQKTTNNRGTDAIPLFALYCPFFPL